MNWNETVNRTRDWLIITLGGVSQAQLQAVTDSLEQTRVELRSLQNDYENMNALRMDCERALVEQNNDCCQLVVQKNEEILQLQADIKHYQEENIHSSLSRFKQYLSTIPSSPRYYNFGHGRKQVHTIFADALRADQMAAVAEFVDEFIEELDYTTADTVVQSFSKLFSKKYPTSFYYAYDEDLYDMVEYWALPSETIANLGKCKYGDCDDIMVLKWACLVWFLSAMFPDDLWRLRGFIVDLWSGGGHALLGWVDGTKNDWIPIETTFRDTDQKILNKYPIRNQLFYQIRYSFDNETEYERI